MAAGGGLIREQAEKLRRALAFSFLRDMVTDPRATNGIGTPRDTGRAASGWTIAAGSPDYRDPGEGSHSVSDPSDALRSLGNPGLEETIYVTNAVPYIGILAGGRRQDPNTGRMVGSEQAPGPFVEQALERIERLFPDSVDRE